MHEDSTEGEEMKRQQGVKVVKDMTKKIGSKGRMDAKIDGGADCDKAWLHAGEKETMPKWCVWLEEMKKKDEKRKME